MSLFLSITSPSSLYPSSRLPACLLITSFISAFTLLFQVSIFHGPDDSLQHLLATAWLPNPMDNVQTLSFLTSQRHSRQSPIPFLKRFASLGSMTPFFSDVHPPLLATSLHPFACTFQLLMFLWLWLGHLLLWLNSHSVTINMLRALTLVSEPRYFDSHPDLYLFTGYLFLNIS